MLKPFFAAILMFIPLLSFAEDFVAGKDYEIISSINTAQTGNPIPVTEYFSYGCPWCYRIEATLNNWVEQQGNAIDFSRVPVVFNKDWTFYAKAYYTAQALGQEAKFTSLLFKAIQDQHQNLNNNQAMIDFFSNEGIDKATAQSAFENSTTIDMRVKEGTALMSRFHVNGVPAVVVNNQYKTDLQMAEGEARLIKLLDFLVAKARAKSA